MSDKPIANHGQLTDVHDDFLDEEVAEPMPTNSELESIFEDILIKSKGVVFF